MGDPVTECIDCINPKASLETFAGFTGIMEGFFKFLPSLITPEFAVDFVTSGPKAVIDLFLEALIDAGLQTPSFSLKAFGIEISVPGVQLDTNLDFPIFDPKPFAEFTLGLINIAIGIPSLFFDLDATPPTPKVPKLPDDLIKFITDNLKLDVNITKVPGFETFITDFPLCIAKSIASVLV